MMTNKKIPGITPKVKESKKKSQSFCASQCWIVCEPSWLVGRTLSINITDSFYSSSLYLFCLLLWSYLIQLSSLGMPFHRFFLHIPLGRVSYDSFSTFVIVVVVIYLFIYFFQVVTIRWKLAISFTIDTMSCASWAGAISPPSGSAGTWCKLL